MKIINKLIALCFATCILASSFFLVACEDAEQKVWKQYVGIYNLSIVDIEITDLGNIAQQGGIDYFNDVVRSYILDRFNETSEGGYITLNANRTVEGTLFYWDEFFDEIRSSGGVYCISQHSISNGAIYCNNEHSTSTPIQIIDGKLIFKWYGGHISYEMFENVGYNYVGTFIKS